MDKYLVNILTYTWAHDPLYLMFRFANGYKITIPGFVILYTVQQESLAGHPYENF